MPGLAIIFHRFGPYHLARLEAAGARRSLIALELSAVDDTYAWSRMDGASNFQRVTLFCDDDVEPRAGARSQEASTPRSRPPIRRSWPSPAGPIPARCLPYSGVCGRGGPRS
jgi:hypothetical protein